MTKPQHPELSAKQRRTRAGRLGAKSSPWRHGFGCPLSPADKGWAERVTTKRPK